ncbi:MAG: hypothetical protein Q8L29_04320 [archaeon]|nr:hypothetical protein [archaeon]
MVCPICTVAIGAGLGFSRALGIDDSLTGLWIGALIVSSAIWMISWMDKKKIHYLFRKISVFAVFYAAVIWPLYHWNYMGIPGNELFGMDKILFGTIMGTLIFFFAIFSDKYIKRNNQGKGLIKYQKVIIPLVFLILSSIITYLLLKIYGV